MEVSFLFSFILQFILQVNLYILCAYTLKLLFLLFRTSPLTFFSSLLWFLYIFLHISLQNGRIVLVLIDSEASRGEDHGKWRRLEINWSSLKEKSVFLLPSGQFLFALNKILIMSFMWDTVRVVIKDKCLRGLARLSCTENASKRREGIREA